MDLFSNEVAISFGNVTFFLCTPFLCAMLWPDTPPNNETPKKYTPIKATSYMTKCIHVSSKSYEESGYNLN